MSGSHNIHMGFWNSSTFTPCLEVSTTSIAFACALRTEELDDGSLPDLGGLENCVLVSPF